MEQAEHLVLKSFDVDNFRSLGSSSANEITHLRNLLAHQLVDSGTFSLLDSVRGSISPAELTMLSRLLTPRAEPDHLIRQLAIARRLLKLIRARTEGRPDASLIGDDATFEDFLGFMIAHTEEPKEDNGEDESPGEAI